MEYHSIQKGIPPDISKYWNPTMETLPREELNKVIEEKLRRQLRYVYALSPLYRRKYDAAGIKPEDIKSLDDFLKVPLLDKDECRAYRDETGDPFGGILCAPVEDIHFVGCTMGTTGEPIWPALTVHDTEMLTELFLRAYWAAGFPPYERATYTMTVSWPGLPAIRHAYAKMGENVAWMPMGSYLDEGLLYKQFLLERDFGMQAAYHAAEMAGMGVTQILARGLNPKDMHISPIKVIQSAGMVTEPRRRYFEQQTGEKVVNNYVTGDLGTLWAECDERKGYHLTQDLVYVEILDQETTKRVAPGERGEIVFSHLDREACPLVRYATGDMGLIWDEPCACGRTQPRLMAIGRIEWGCKIKDKTITPYDMEELMGEIDETWGKEYTIYRYAPIMDKLRCKLQYAEEKTKDKEVLKQRLINKMRDRWGIDADVELVTSAEELPTRAWKVMHVIDVE